MNDDEIKRYIAQMKGEMGDNGSDDDEKNKTGLTRTIINQDDIEFDIKNELNDKTHLEYDENDMPISNKTSPKLKGRKKMIEVEEENG